VTASKIPALVKTPQAQAVYVRLIERVETLGPFEVEVKKTCIHLANGRAFAGVHPRINGIMVQIVSDAPIKSPRVNKVEQASANRFHCAVKLETEKDVNAELLGWLKKARKLKSK
jgi:hypothetical protein